MRFVYVMISTTNSMPCNPNKPLSKTVLKTVPVPQNITALFSEFWLIILNNISYEIKCNFTSRANS